MSNKIIGIPSKIIWQTQANRKCRSKCVQGEETFYIDNILSLGSILQYSKPVFFHSRNTLLNFDTIISLAQPSPIFFQFITCSFQQKNTQVKMDMDMDMEWQGSVLGPGLSIYSNNIFILFYKIVIINPPFSISQTVPY